MIELTRLNGKSFVVNADLIETVEATPDTVVTLVTGKRFVVLNRVPEVVERVIAYHRQTGGSARFLKMAGLDPSEVQENG